MDEREHHEVILEFVDESSSLQWVTVTGVMDTQIWV